MNPRRALVVALLVGSVIDAAYAADTAPCGDHERCDEPAPGECPVIQSVYDVDVPKALVRGVFTVNGQDPIPWDSQSGRIELRSETLGVADLGPIHEGGYDAFVVPGTYDVVYKHNSGTLVPANAESVLIEDLVIADGEYDFDVPSVLVTGDITLNGGAFPNSVYERGTIRFRDVETGASFEVGRSWDGDYSVLVMPGTYDVVWSRANGNFVPMNDDAVVLAGVVVDQSADIDVDVKALTVNGTFTLDGAAPPNSIYENARISLRDPVTGDLVELGQTRDRVWSKRLAPGTYDVVYQKMVGGSFVPANEFAVIATGVRVTNLRSMAINIPSVRVVGAFELDGALFPASIYNTATISLERERLVGDDVLSDRVELGVTPDQGYDLRVLPGTYDIVYEGFNSTGAIPENERAVISTGNAIGKPMWGALAFLDVEVESGFIDADATWWGAPFPASIYENGAIVAVGAGGATTLFQSRDGGASVRMVAGDYDLHWSHWQGDDVPRNEDGRVGEATASVFVMPATADVESGLLAGVFTQGGVTFPELDDHYGVISLRDVETGDVIALGQTDEVQYDLELLSGTYEVLYDHVEGNSVVGNVGANLGCVTFAPIAPYPSGDQAPSRAIPSASIQR